jgi:hypothetical protein
MGELVAVLHWAASSVTAAGGTPGTSLCCVVPLMREEEMD